MRLSMSHRIPIVEDDWARLLRFDGAADPPLKHLDQGGYVIHIGTFSKVFLPGLRVGWITCPSAISVPLLRAKAGSDQSDSFFLQMLLHDLIERGHFVRHLRHANKIYRQRRDAMCETLLSELPDGCRFSVPHGGFSVWLELPEPLMSVPLLTLARQAGVDFVPAAFVMPDRRDAPALRLSFSRNPPERIQQGIKILCGVISDCVKNPDLLEAGAKKYDDLF
jgi:DNA-binding transcriptional MocR family regulator